MSPPDCTNLQPMNINYWMDRFEKNARNRREPEWQAPVTLTGRPLTKLRKSLQQFQLGDGGGPASLIGWNRTRYLAADPDMEKLIELWFSEEKEHSRLLGSALRRLAAPEITGHWSFSLFCGVRKILGVRFELQALLLTEIVSQVYYKMLHRHVGDPAIRRMCALIIRDESGHIAFHRARLASEHRRNGHTPELRWPWLFRLRGLMAGTILWVNHRSALRAFGARDSDFYRGIWKGMGRFLNGLQCDLSHEQVSAISTQPLAPETVACARYRPGNTQPKLS